MHRGVEDCYDLPTDLAPQARILVDIGLDCLKNNQLADRTTKRAVAELCNQVLCEQKDHRAIETSRTAFPKPDILYESEAMKEAVGNRCDRVPHEQEKRHAIKRIQSAVPKQSSLSEAAEILDRMAKEFVDEVRRLVTGVSHNKQTATAAEDTKTINWTRTAVPKPDTLLETRGIVNLSTKELLERTASARSSGIKVASINQTTAVAENLQSPVAHDSQEIDTASKTEPKPLTQIHGTPEIKTKGITFPTKPARFQEAAQRSTTEAVSINPTMTAAEDLKPTAAHQPEGIKATTKPEPKPLTPAHQTSEIETGALRPLSLQINHLSSQLNNLRSQVDDTNKVCRISPLIFQRRSSLSGVVASEIRNSDAEAEVFLGIWRKRISGSRELLFSKWI
ncbi:MAG: hypothetical protein Q9201_001757 [Fulgogasparrea decipioides]